MKSIFVFLWVVFGFAGMYYGVYYESSRVERSRELYMKQFTNDDNLPTQIRQESIVRSEVYYTVWLLWLISGVAMLFKDIKRILGYTGLFLVLFVNAGCYRPYEPVDLQTINTNEEGFLIPLQGDTTKQVSTASEEFLKQNLVHTKQVRIPQQWVKTGYEWVGMPNGKWQPSAILIKVDRAPVTREWTADEKSGTSNKNEAVWVMTSDQVEFSTGWTCTARIASRDDAVKFLSNYPNGTLEKVLDEEVRSKIQSEFGYEVTDLPMDELRKNATPHITKVVKTVRDFFEQRGITITNLGITGGFVYKNTTIQEKLVEVFNAEQEKNISLAKAQAQEQENKRVVFEATGKADAILKQKKAEADGIKMVADAKNYEIQQAKQDLNAYLELKRLEIQKAQIEKWNGQFPYYFMGTNPNLLLQVPANEKPSTPKQADKTRE